MMSSERHFDSSNSSRGTKPPRSSNPSTAIKHFRIRAPASSKSSLEKWRRSSWTFWDTERTPTVRTESFTLVSMIFYETTDRETQLGPLTIIKIEPTPATPLQTAELIIEYSQAVTNLQSSKLGPNIPPIKQTSPNTIMILTTSQNMVDTLSRSMSKRCRSELGTLWERFFCS